MRLCAIALVASVICAQTATAGEYVNRTHQFRVTVPDGWKLVEAEGKLGEAAIVGLISPRFDATSSLCLFAAASEASTRGLSQETLNEGMASEVNEAFWRSTLEDETVKDLEIVETRTELKNGRRGYYALVRLTSIDEGKETPEQQWHVLFLVPGRIHLGMCGVDIQHVSTEEPDIKTITGSYEPTGAGAVVSKLESAAPQTPPAGQLVLHGGPRFDGPSQVLTLDVPNLPAAGWRLTTASFNLRGYGLWQICDGTNYQGNCRIVAGAESAALGGRALRIGSARRVIDPRDPRNALGVVSDTIARMLKRDRPQFRKRQRSRD